MLRQIEGHVQKGAQTCACVGVCLCVCGVFPPVFTRVSLQPLLHIWCGSRASWGLAAVVGRLGGRKKAEKEMNQARERGKKGEAAAAETGGCRMGLGPLPVRFRKGRGSLRLFWGMR